MSHEDVLGKGFFTSESTYPDWRYPDTDTANADRLVAQFSDELCYCSDRKIWCVWNGKIWCADDVGGVMRRVEDVTRHIYIEAGEERDKDRRTALVKWAKTSESRRNQENSIALARWKKEIEVRKFSEKFDTHPLLLNVANGTVDLFTGEHREYKREDFLTKIVPIEYNDAAECPKFIKFLSGALPDEGMMGYLSRFIGYCLTGSVSEQAWFMFYGITSSGKSTLINILRGLLGPLSYTLPDNYFLATQETNDYTT